MSPYLLPLSKLVMNPSVFMSANVNFVRTFSVIGTSTLACRSRRPRVPVRTWTRPPNASPAGSRVTYWMAPPRAELPNNVPCGPRSTSMRSTSTTPIVKSPMALV